MTRSAGASLLGLGIILGIALTGSFAWFLQGSPWPHKGEDWTAIFTGTLTISTIALWWATASLAREARDSAKTIIKLERPYVTGGGDFVKTNGVELFRLDVENHGKTAAFMTGYDLQFAKLEELQEEERKKEKARRVDKSRRHIDGISPAGARKNIFTQIPKEEGADVVFGAVWYKDPILGKEEHHSRFILRIAPRRDIPGEGLTRLDVKDVSDEYWSWDY